MQRRQLLPYSSFNGGALPMASGGAPDGHSAPTHKVVENSKKKKKFVDLKSMWGRAEKKQKFVVQSNSPEPVQEVGCNKGQELAIVETEPQFGNGSTEASKPQVASTQSEDEDWWEDYDDDVDYLPHDPGKRIAITDYDANLQDEVRRRYIALGPCRPALQNFSQRNVGGKRRFMRSWFDKYNWLEYSEEKDAAFYYA